MSVEDIPPETQKLMDEFEIMLQKGVGEAKVTLVDAAGEEHYADLHVLKARSPVLDRMFNSDMSETRSHRVVLGDARTTTVKQFVKFLYTSCYAVPFDYLDEMICLAALGDKYEVTSLVDCCIREIKSEMCPRNVAGILKLADQKGLKVLKQICIKYATSNAAITRAMQESTEFENLPANLLLELFVGFSGSATKRKRNDTLEFPAGSDWTRLSYVQLKRACDERSLEVDGERPELIARLQSVEQTVSDGGNIATPSEQDESVLGR
eukprot:gnl/MRDRNA2_/MRDRNA2_152008_c0_seq1.p1 gnl/MRDRNA2_/MRDRNA2_152008_c0~~gnl/MRDRNA2_/MRDRNA2_152008_c0_seq1.p1  ORF type:complete len:310 (+),score=45.38 gnl/MRDRNA2_/MRDRNA2_152008_c0_seq1:133-930(+)